MTGRSDNKNRAAMIHEKDCPSAWEFFNKHGLGSKLAPSCLVCGKVPADADDIAIRHMELPNIIVCKRCLTRSADLRIEGAEWAGDTIKFRSPEDAGKVADAIQAAWLMPSHVASMEGSDMRAPEQPCGGCGKPLLIENAWMEDGCPCNTPAGVNNFNLYRWRLLHELQQKQSRELEAARSATGDSK